MTAQKQPIVLIYAARALRGFGDGFAIILLPVYLTLIGHGPAEIGIVATAALLGSAATTLAVGILARYHQLRTLLLLGAKTAAFLRCLPWSIRPAAISDCWYRSSMPRLRRAPRIMSVP